MQAFLVFLLYSTLSLFIGGGVVGLLLRFSGCQSPAWNRFAWTFVLLLGVACLRLPLEIQVLTQPPATSTPVSQAVAAAVIYSAPKTESLVPQRAWLEFFQTYTIPLIFAVWLIGAALIFAAQLFFWYRTVRQAKGAAIPEEFFLSEWRRTLAFYGLDNRKIELRTAENAGPGLLRLPAKSIVIVPTALWEEAPEHVRLGILKHELSHYRRHDLWKSLALRTLALLHWFNPMAHYAVRKFDEAAEWRCDADAFGGAENAESVFAETMLLFRDTVPVAAVCRTAFRGNNIKRRSERLIHFTQRKGDSPMKKTLIASCCTAMLLLGVFEIRLTAQPRPTAVNQQPVVEIAGLSAMNQKTKQRQLADTLAQSPVESVDLDISQHQVLIDVRVISATRSFFREIVNQFGFGKGQVSALRIVDPRKTGQLFSAMPDNAVHIVNHVDLSQFDAAIAAGESKGLVKLIEKPAVLTLFNTTASLFTGIRSPLPITLNNTTAVEFYDTFGLEVTPQITYEGNIILDMKYKYCKTEDDFDYRSTDVLPCTGDTEKSISVMTSMLLNDGGMALFGGTLIQDENSGETRELLLFITPTITR